MMTTFDGSLFDAPTRAIVNPVNCLGAMGAGLAREFAGRFPEASRAYRVACRRGEMRTGSVLVVDDADRQVVHLPTKRDWRAPSRMEWIEAGLAACADALDTGRIADLTLPAIGCGHGGLEWGPVRAAMDRILGARPEPIIVIEPQLRAAHRRSTPR